jgi:hypothetical protein
MNYVKPQVALLGDAKSLVQLLNGLKVPLFTFDGDMMFRTIPAYDLDE